MVVTDPMTPLSGADSGERNSVVSTYCQLEIWECCLDERRLPCLAISRVALLMVTNIEPSPRPRARRSRRRPT